MWELILGVSCGMGVMGIIALIVALAVSGCTHLPPGHIGYRRNRLTQRLRPMDSGWNMLSPWEAHAKFILPSDSIRNFRFRSLGELDLQYVLPTYTFTTSDLVKVTIGLSVDYKIICPELVAQHGRVHDLALYVENMIQETMTRIIQSLPHNAVSVANIEQSLRQTHWTLIKDCIQFTSVNILTISFEEAIRQRQLDCVVMGQ